MTSWDSFYFARTHKHSHSQRTAKSKMFLRSNRRLDWHWQTSASSRHHLSMVLINMLISSCDMGCVLLYWRAQQIRHPVRIGSCWLNTPPSIAHRWLQIVKLFHFQLNLPGSAHLPFCATRGMFPGDVQNDVRTRRVSVHLSRFDFTAPAALRTNTFACSTDSTIPRDSRNSRGSILVNNFVCRIRVTDCRK